MRFTVVSLFVALLLLLGHANAFSTFTVLPGLFSGATPENDPFVFSVFGNVNSDDVINGRVGLASSGAWSGSSVSALITESDRTNSASDYINFGLSTGNFLPSAAEGTVVFVERTYGNGGGRHSEIVPVGAITSYSIDAYAPSFRIYFTINNPNPASLVFRYSNGVNQTAAEMGATCTVTTATASLGCSTGAYGGLRQGNPPDYLADCNLANTAAAITCTRSTNPFNFLASGPLEVDATAFGGSTWRQVQRIRPTIIPSSTIYRPAGGDISATFDGRALASYNLTDACTGTFGRNVIALCSFDFSELTSSSSDHTGALSATGPQNWWDTARDPRGLYSNVPTAGADSGTAPNRPGILAVGAKAIAGYTVFTGTAASGSSRVVKLSLPTSGSPSNGVIGLTTIGFVYPSITENALAISASASSIAVPAVRLGLTSGSGLELQWDSPSEAQNMTGCTYNDVSFVLTCNVPPTGIMRSGAARVRYFITGRSYVPSYTSTTNFVSVSHVVTTAAASLTDYPSAATVTLTLAGAGLRGVSTVISGSSVGSCASGFVPASNGASLSCTTYIPASHAGTTVLETTSVSTISTTILSTRPVITSSTTNVSADSTSVVINGRGFGNSSSPAPTVSLGVSASSLPSASDFGATFSISSRTLR